MSALKKKDEAADPREHETIKQMRSEAEAIIEDIRVAAAHTATEGWQALYAGNRKKKKDRQSEIGKSLHSLADRIVTHGWDEDDEKAVKALVKESLELRETHAAFNTETVYPVMDSVSRLSACVSNWQSQAERVEKNAPLHTRGLADAMAEAIKALPNAKWDPSTGVVTIEEGGAS